MGHKVDVPRESSRPATAHQELSQTLDRGAQKSHEHVVIQNLLFVIITWGFQQTDTSAPVKTS